MIEFMLAVPEALSEIWYVYDLVLIGVIVICAVLIGIFKEKSSLATAEKCLNDAKRTMKKLLNMNNTANIRIKLITFVNVIKSAEYYYTDHVNEKDAFDYRERLAVVSRVREKSEALAKATVTAEEMRKTLAEINTLLENC